MSGIIFSGTGLVSKSIELIHTIRKARDRVNMAQKTSLDISKQIDSTLATLDTINREPRLQVDKIKQPMENIVLIEKELQAALDERQEDAKRPKFQQFSKSLCISTIHIGLTGNLESGFRVARGEMQRINGTVQEVYGQPLVLMERVGPRWQNLTQDTETEQFKRVEHTRLARE